MENNTSSIWLRIEVVEVVQGAAYEGIAYDQDLIGRTAEGQILTLFDMTPMIGTSVRPGEIIDVIVAISSPINLKWNDAAEGDIAAVIHSTNYMPNSDSTAKMRAELFERRWIHLGTPIGSLLTATTEDLPDFADNTSLGKKVSWENGRFDLMACKKYREAM